MSGLKIKAHYVASFELLEVMAIASLLALIADACWIVRDISVNGPTMGLCLICVGLWTALIIMAIGFYKYHIKAVKQILNDMLKAKIKINKSKRRAKVK